MRIAGPNMFQKDAVCFCTEYKLAADVLRLIIAANRLWFAAPLDELIPCAHDAFCRQ